MDRRAILKTGAIALGSSMAPRVAAASTEPQNPNFPDDFLWGVSTAGHQVEGNNTNSDFWLMEHAQPAGFAEPSGDANNSLFMWPSDLEIVRDLGLNTYRFSLEWSRIEPEEGHFSVAMLDHYLRMIDACVANGITPIVTFNHFTCPIWFTASGGWRSSNAADRFARYCARTASHLAENIGYAVTLNEPNLPALLLHVNLPPEELVAMKANRQSVARSLGIDRFDGGFRLDREEYWPMVPNLAAAHQMGRDAIKTVRPDLPVGMTLAVADEHPVGENSMIEERRAELYHPWFEAGADDDYSGVQNYTRSFIGPEGQLRAPEGTELSSMHMEVYPPSLAGAVRYTHEATGKPILITEHGVATSDDEMRHRFIGASLPYLKAAMEDGVPVLGYIHWSLADNYEWYDGYEQQLGLCTVDRETFVRTPKPSARLLAQYAQANSLRI